MWIVPVSALSPCELARLGNNIRPVKRPPDTQVRAVNRSLSVVGEEVRRLLPIPLHADWGRSAPVARTRRRSA